MIQPLCDTIQYHSMILRETVGSDKTRIKVRDVAGVILAGGKAKRYGTNKALAELGGVPLIERVIEKLSAVFSRIHIITNTPQTYAHLKLPMHQDLIKGLGPLGGIYTALKAIEEERGFFVACDMPFLNPDLIRYMVQKAPGHDVVIPRIGQYIEPLHAIYSKVCLPHIERIIGRDEVRIVKFFHEVKVLYVEEEEVRQFDPGLDCFMNVNTPEDLRRLERQWRN